MIVQAKCVADAFDNTASKLYEAGKTYQIDTESDVARLAVLPLKKGRPIKPCFQFDKSVVIDHTNVADGHAVETSAKVKRGYQKRKGYTCSKCGEIFKTRTKLAGHQKKHGIGAKTLEEMASEKDAATEAA
jgi:hypothetical protein